MRNQISTALEILAVIYLCSIVPAMIATVAESIYSYLTTRRDPKR